LVAATALSHSSSDTPLPYAYIAFSFYVNRFCWNCLRAEHGHFGCRATVDFEELAAAANRVGGREAVSQVLT
jgi:hypothetical protein